MTQRSVVVSSIVTLAAWLTAAPGSYAQTAPAGLKGEPDKTLAAAHESFVKKDMDKAGVQVHKAAAYVAKESDKVAADCKAGVKKASAGLDTLGDNIKKGSVKSADDINKCAASTDHALAHAWFQTADEAKRAGKDSTEALKKSGAALESAAKWSGQQLNEGTQASLKAVKQAGKATGAGAKAGADEVNKWFKDIGTGIEDLGRKL
jgi:hypothetical protein